MSGRRIAASLLACAAALAALAACSSATKRSLPPLADQVANGDRDPEQALLAELQAEVLESYERDDPPDLETAVLPIGAARIGVGPGDVLVDQELVNASSRWPLMIDAETPTAVRSKRLELHLAKDRSAAWVFDEVSWRIEICKRTLVIPLRLASLYARDGDRWVLAVEHLSTGAELPSAGPLIGRSFPSAEVSRDLGDDVSRSVALLLRGPVPESPLVSTGAEAALLGPSWSQEWHGAAVLAEQLFDGSISIEDSRIGVVGRDPARATIAYWVGNLIGTAVSGQRARLRATFVLERRPGATGAPKSSSRWVVVQGHVSLPVDDETLAQSAVGSALLSLNPLVARCPDSARGQPAIDAASGAAVAPARPH